MHWLGSTQLAPQDRQRAVSVRTCSSVSVPAYSRKGSAFSLALSVAGRWREEVS
jgi:hypothetical protein